ncbi:MAG TPA: hypothetical protein VFI91_03830 [Longimicrobiaceae bacterium]|nr:hypothetical protein [Longimicrobiaceae bacterium]
MHLRLKRLDDRRYETEITRSDGVTYHVKGVGHMGAIPHDLAHFVVEQALGIRQGFWGSVADGAVFGSLTHISGRRRPQATQRSKDILKANKKVLTETEILVGLFNQAFEDRLGADSSILRDRLRRYTWTPPGHQPRKITDEQISAVCSAWEDMHRLWQRLKIGETLDLDWPDG